MLAALAEGLEGIDGGIGGGGGGRHGLGVVGFLPILVASGMARIDVGAGIGDLTEIPSVVASFLTLDHSNFSAMSFCMCLNLGL